MHSASTSPDPSSARLQSGFYSIPAGMAFASYLARGVLNIFGRADSLSSVQILLPSRRAVYALQAAFIDASDGVPLLLPKMTPIGDVEEDASDMLSFSLGRGDDGDLTLPPSISPVEKQLILTRLIERLPLAGQAISTAQAVRLAQSLGHLLDQIYQAGTMPEKLAEQMPEDLARHWQDILTFLNIIIEQWPQILQSRGLLDPVIRKMMLADQQIESWKTAPPGHPVILAGSTGSLPKTRQMMAAVAELPCGMVVFPGLDNRHYSPSEYEAISADTGHPFHQLLKTLNYLDIAPEAVRSWPDHTAIGISDIAPPNLNRTEFLKQVFKPAPLTRDWRRIREDFPEMDKSAISGLSVIAARDMQQEADIIAAVMRKTLEDKTKTAMLVTPDRKLARQVRAALLKWDLDIEDSAGTPLKDSYAGSFLTLIAEWFASAGRAQDLLALLKHPLASAGLPYAKYQKLVRRLESEGLRGYLADSSVKGISARLRAQKNSAEILAFYEQNILGALAPLTALLEHPGSSLDVLADAHGKAAELLAQSDIENEAVLKLWESPDGKQAAALLAELSETGRENAIRQSEYAGVFRALSEGYVVRRVWRSHPRLAILGTVEARMQNADLIILGGVNEGVWPPRQQADPWTNDTIRQGLGLPDRRWRSGLSAHDFFMLAAHDEVIITRSVRADDAPTTPSRWLERMEAVLHASALKDGLVTTADAEVMAAISACQHLPVQAIEMPRPCPALSLRPKQYSATDFDMLISDPYQIYARKILRLRPLDEMDKRPDNALKGNLIHEILGDFLQNYPEGDLPEDAAEQLCTAAEKCFAPYLVHPPVQLFWQTKFREIAHWFCQNEQERRAGLEKSFAEETAKITIPTDAGEVAITARADRLDKLADGRIAIIDYKTGSMPNKKQVEQGRAAQLLVEAALLGAGGFSVPLPDFDDHNIPIPQLSYWQLSGHYGRIAEIKEVTPNNLDIARLIDHLSDLVTCFSRADTPFLPEPDPASRPKFSDYRHLARVREWRPQEVKDD
ncbi:MAG: double-strand break repair protein AddB [Candidatus Puniceispirillaceae bacterium]